MSTKRLRPHSSEALLLAHLDILDGFPTFELPFTVILAAVRTHYGYPISFWDSMIVEGARHGGAELLYSQDLQDGLNFDGIRVANPFL